MRSLHDALSKGLETLMLALATIVLIAGLRGTELLSAAADEGCGPVVPGSLNENAEFTPYESMRSRLPDYELPRATGIPGFAKIRDQVIGGLPRQSDVVTDEGTVVTYFAKDFPPGIRLSEFIVSGGIQLHQLPSTTEVDESGRSVSFTERLTRQVGARGLRVQVGPYNGLLTWADPDVLGTRPHHLYWSTEDADYTLIADVSAEELLALGRDLICN